MTRDTVADLQADLTDLAALDDPAHELVPGLVEEVEGRALGLHHLGDAREDELEQLLQVEGGPEGEADLAERSAHLLLVGELELELGHPRGPRRCSTSAGGAPELRPTAEVSSAPGVSRT